MYYYQHNIGDFDKATRHLTRVERSVYRDLIELYYDTEMRLNLDVKHLCRKILAHSNEESTAVQQVLNEFFDKTESGWYHSRCEHEIERYHSSISQKAEAGKKSAAARQEKRQRALNGCSTGEQREVNGEPTKQEPITNNQKPINNKQKRSAKSADFEPSAKLTFSQQAFNVFWDQVELKRTGKADAFKAFEKYTSGKTEDEIDFVLNVICHWYDLYLKEDEARSLPENKKYLKNAATWLNSAPWRVDQKSYVEFKNNYYGENNES